MAPDWPQSPKSCPTGIRPPKALFSLHGFFPISVQNFPSIQGPFSGPFFACPLLPDIFNKQGKEEAMKVFAAILIVVLALPVLCQAGEVRGYWRDSNGDGIKDSWVSPYQRTNPNSTRMDNYSYPGNFNPNTGRITPPSSSPWGTYPPNPNPYNAPRQQQSPNRYGW